MKKKLILLACMATMSFAACNKEKDWKCHCEKNGATHADYTILDLNKSDAKDMCKKYEDKDVTCSLD